MSMIALIHALAHRLSLQPAVLVRVQASEGSVPREAGAWMAVCGDEVLGTIGGGHLEFEAIAHAHQRLAALASGQAAAAPELRRYPLGPRLGQCCGGVVHLLFEDLRAVDAGTLPTRLMPPLQPLALFGGGHVGQALVQVLATLPYAVTWVDSRESVFPQGLPPQIHCEHSDPVQDAVAGLAPGSTVVVMSFSHAEDLDIVAACLRRQRTQGDLPFIGLIGSRTKWATFGHRLRARGYTEAELAQVTCPIGVPGLQGKEPAVIAVSVAAQLLMRRKP